MICWLEYNSPLKNNSSLMTIPQNINNIIIDNTLCFENLSDFACTVCKRYNSKPIVYSPSLNKKRFVKKGK